jgi:hypothetical protein
VLGVGIADEVFAGGRFRLWDDCLSSSQGSAVVQYEVPRRDEPTVTKENLPEEIVEGT